MNKYDIASYLIESGADVNLLNSQLQNSLHVAAEIGNVNIGNTRFRSVISSGLMSATRREN